MKDSNKSETKRLIIQFIIFTGIGMIGGLAFGYDMPQYHLYYTIPIGGVVGYMIRATGLVAKYGYY
jgi:hypothetical protein